ncbi:PQQ-dependent sugar dehydrogenase [uncultured Paraglaciecola sp.]|uniref:PQQ-dependent sugar dehydrogenase n=1 Tax=uncultured Paraglaciecola sp. TaxID=1765024 RepID=UPI00260EF385|nr:PQQ-dependent sugar dehydrogenase [uncultured Paraglaciecola sp.]
MYKYLIRGLLLLLLLWLMPVQSQTINLIEAIKVKNGHRAEALFYYQNNWRIFRESALARGYIDSYEFVEASSQQNAEFDFLLITRFANQDQQDKSEQRFDKIIAQRTGLMLLNEIEPKDFRQSVFVKMAKGNNSAGTHLGAVVKEQLIDGLDNPWSMAFINESEVLVSEKDGNLLKLNLLTKQKTIIQNFPNDLAKAVAIDVSKYEKGIYPASMNGILSSYNMGMFDVVLDPNFATNQLLYVSYVSKKADTYTTKVIRATLNNNQLADVKTLLVADPYTPGGYHFGGGLTFGQDGKLYITIGERLFNEMNQPAMPIAQNLLDKRGKIHRINPDGSIPTDNPIFANRQSSIYAIGIRAAQGITVNPDNGDIWFSEHGTHQGDELNLLKAGANYGWPIKTTGKYRFKEYQPPALSERTFSRPKWFWKHTVAPTGLTFYKGDEFPQWQGDLFIPGLSGGSLWRIRIEDEKVKATEELFVDDRVRSRKVVQSPMGKLYLLTDENNGKIMRIRRAK